MDTKPFGCGEIEQLQKQVATLQEGVDNLKTAYQTMLALHEAHRDAMMKAMQEVSEHQRLFMFAFGVDLKNPESVATAMKNRFQLRDAQRVGLVLLGTGVAGILAALINLADFLTK